MILQTVLAIVFATCTLAADIAPEILPFLAPLYSGDSFEENRFVGDFVSPTSTFFAGQDARVRVSTRYLSTEGTAFGQSLGGPHNTNTTWFDGASVFPAFNITGPSHLRVRVIPAFDSRAGSGTPSACASTSDVHAEFWAFGGRTFAGGPGLVFSAHVTLTVPPFPWKVCVKDTWRRTAPAVDAGRNLGFVDLEGVGVQRPLEPLYLFRAPSTLQTGDFAAVSLIANGRPTVPFANGNTFDPLQRRGSGDDLSRGDSVKLVPAGLPCSYEKATARSDESLNTHGDLKLTQAQYCGTNYVKEHSGHWAGSACVSEGSVPSGVGRTGSQRRSPWASHSDSMPPGGLLAQDEQLTAFIKLPASGDYEVCVSPWAYRLALLNATVPNASTDLFNAAPVWFKAYRATSGCPTSDTITAVDCRPRFSVLSVAPPDFATRWSVDDATPGSFGWVTLHGAGLSSTPATQWEYSSPRNYFETEGGDQFRLVPAGKFTDADATSDFVLGTLYKHGDGSRWMVDIPVGGGGTTAVPRIGAVWASSGSALDVPGSVRTDTFMATAPHHGTPQQEAGCFSNNDDFGTTSTDVGEQCCTADASGSCTSTDCSRSDAGPRTSGDLGGSPRDERSWSLNATGAAKVWAYVRFPSSGTYRVCYRKKGRDSWRVIQSTAGASALPTDDRSAAVSAAVQDRRESSLAQVIVSTPTAVLTTATSNIHTTVADSAVVGSQLKLVPEGRDCTRYATEPWHDITSAGTAECTMAACASQASCAGCRGSAATDSTSRQSVVFMLPLPALSEGAAYRLCFRNGLGSWHILRNTAAASSLVLNLEPRPPLVFTLGSSISGTWAPIRFTTADPVGLNTAPSPAGDVMRLVPDVASAGPTLCSVVWDTVTQDSAPVQAQRFQPALSAANVGAFCSTPGTGDCAAAAVAPASGDGSIGTYPYTVYNPQADAGAAVGTVAFLMLPPPASYRVCYKQAGKNWVEATSATPRVTTVTEPGFAVSIPQGVLAGESSYVDVTAASAPHPVSHDLVKFLDPALSCERSSLGSVKAYNKYQSLRKAGSTASLPNGTRFFMTMPTASDAAFGTMQARVCFMHRGSELDTTKNWRDLGLVVLMKHGVTARVPTTPVRGGSVTVLFDAAPGAPLLNSAPGMDAAKIIHGGAACTSESQSVDPRHSTLDLAARRRGATDLGPADSPAVSQTTLVAVLPATDSPVKLCYQMSGRPWVEVELALSAPGRVDGIAVDLLGALGFTALGPLRAQIPQAHTQAEWKGVPWSLYLAAGASTQDSTRTLLTVHTTGAVASTDRWRFILVASDSEAGVAPPASPSCDQPTPYEGPLVPSGTDGLVHTNIPTTPGRYFLCVRLGGRWGAVPGEPRFGGLVGVAPVYFRAVVNTASATVTVADGFASDGLAQASLTAADLVYLTSAAGTCGVTGGVEGEAVASTARPLANQGSGITRDPSTARLTDALPWLTAPYLQSHPGPWRLCFFHASTATGVAGVVSPAGTGWYQLPDITGSELVTAVVPTKVVASCPGAGPHPAGVPLKIPVSVATPAGTVVVASGDTPAHEVRAELLGGTLLSNVEGSCSPGDAVTYGWSAANLQQYTRGGRVFFSLIPDRSCPVSGCRVRFSSGSLTPAECTFQVAAESASRITVDVSRSRVHPGQTTWVVVRGFLSNGDVATTSPTPVALSAQATPGRTMEARPEGGAWQPLSTDTEVGLLSQGQLRVEVRATVSDFTLASEQNVTVGVALGAVQASVWAVFPTNAVAGLHLVDLYHSQTETPMAQTSAAADLALIPSWRRAGHTTSLAAPPVQSVVTAATGDHLVARVFYTVVIRLLGHGNAGPVFLESLSQLPPADRHLDIALETPSSENAVWRYSPSCNTADGCASDPFQAVPLADGAVKVVFALRNSHGCPGGRCRIVITAGASGSLVVDTMVRSPAARIEVDCFVAPNVSASPVNVQPLAATRGSCPAAALERGWVLRARAVGIDNDTDAVFGGRALVALGAGSWPLFPATWQPLANSTSLENEGNPQHPSATGWGLASDGSSVPQFPATWPRPGLGGALFPATVPELRSLSHFGQAHTVTAQFVQGSVQVDHVTLSQPCDDCSLVVASDWGATAAVVPLGALTTTPRELQCTLETKLVRCAGSAGCSAVDDFLEYDPASEAANVRGVVYSDTEICVAVAAVDAEGHTALTESQWVTASVLSAGNAALVGAGVRPLYRGATRFCVKAQAAAETTISLRFDVQAVWAQPSGRATCRVGAFTLLPQKHIAQLHVTSISGAVEFLRAPPSTHPAIVAGSDGSGMQVGVALAPVDHYGNSVAGTALRAADADLRVVIDGCFAANVTSPTGCVAGTIGTVGGPRVGVRGDGGSIGALVLHLRDPVQPSVAVGAHYFLSVHRGCLDCYFSFSLRRPDDHVVASSFNGTTFSVLTELRAVVDAHVLLTGGTTKPVAAFASRSSPLRGSYWIKHAAAGDERNTYHTGKVVLFKNDCLVGASPCAPTESYFLRAAADVNPTVLDSAPGQPLRLVAARGLADAVVTPLHEVGCLNDDCRNAVKMHVDILHSYNVTVSAGPQVLRCRESVCRNTAQGFTVEVLRLGATPLEAVRAFIARGRRVPVVEVSLFGEAGSQFYSVAGDGRYADAAKPLQSGPLIVSAVPEGATPVQGMSTAPYDLVWRGASVAQRVAFLPTARNVETPAAETVPTADPTSFTGYLVPVLLREWNSSQAIAGVPHPVTVDVLASGGGRAFGATGTMSLVLSSWTGCNNGGTITVSTDAVSNGRLTAWVTFSAACEACVLRARFTPAVAPQTAALVASPAAQLAWSHPLVVRSQSVVASAVAVTTPADTVPDVVTVADTVTVDLKTVGILGVRARDVPGIATVTAHIEALHRTPTSTFLSGNGGVLRPSADFEPSQHNGTAVSFTATGRLSLTFTRTCDLGCRVWVEFLVGSSSGRFALRNRRGTTFRVATHRTHDRLVGHRVPVFPKGGVWTASLWAVGSEAATGRYPIAVAGFATEDRLEPRRPSFSVVDSSNSDGGRLSVRAWRFPGHEVQALSFARSCKQCHVVISPDVAWSDAWVQAKATQLYLSQESWTGTDPGATHTYTAAAVDADGAVDVLFGSSSVPCTHLQPGQCRELRVTTSATVQLQATGFASAAPFAPFANGAASVTGNLNRGIGSLQLALAGPVRQAIPRFTASHGTLSVHGNGSVFSVATAAGTPTVLIAVSSSVAAYRPVDLTVAVVREVAGVQYIDAAASAALSVSFTGCPARTAETPPQLQHGEATVRVVFTGAGTGCKVSATVDGVGSSEATLSVAAAFAQRWAFASPTAIANDAARAGPMYGAAGQTLTLTVQAFSAEAHAVESCDDPATSLVETCELRVTSTGCAPAPAVAVGSVSAGLVMGNITFAGSGTGYACPLQVALVRVGSDLPPVAGTQSSVTVDVCVPHRLATVQNMTKTTWRSGVRYPLEVASLQADGSLCKGDGSFVSLAATAADGGSIGVPIAALNTNVTSASGRSMASSTVLPTTGARFLGGRFRFLVLFTNSSGGKPVVVTAESPAGRYTSHAAVVGLGASSLRFHPDTHPPRYAVTDRRLVSAHQRGYGLVVQATDGLDPEWAVQGLVPRAPNVAASYQLPESTARIVWNVKPTTAAFPLWLDGVNDPDARLVYGEQRVQNLTWAGPAATVDINVQAAVADLTPTPSYRMTMQTATQFGLLLSDGTTTVPLCLSAACDFFGSASNGAFHVKSLAEFTVTVVVADGSGATVLGENETVVEAYLTTSVGAFLVDSATPTVRQTSLMARVRQGRATFNLTFTGHAAGGSALQIGFRCAAERPVAMLLPWERLANPCAHLAEIRTKPLVVSDGRAPASAFASPGALGTLRIARLQSIVGTLSSVPWGEFTREVAVLLNRQHKYISPTNEEGVVTVLACVVDTTGFLPWHDLGNTVCQSQGARSTCTDGSERDGCPLSVKFCRCPDDGVTTTTTRRSVAQAAATPTPDGVLIGETVATQVELSFRLNRAAAYGGQDGQQIGADSAALAAQVVAALTNDNALRQRYYFNETTFSYRAGSAALTTVTPRPATPAPPSSAGFLSLVWVGAAALLLLLI